MPPIIDPDMTFFLAKLVLDAPDSPGSALERLLDGSRFVAGNVAPATPGPSVGSDKAWVRDPTAGSEIEDPSPEFVVGEDRAGGCISGREVDAEEGEEVEAGDLIVVEGRLAEATDEES